MSAPIFRPMSEFNPDARTYLKKPSAFVIYPDAPQKLRTAQLQKAYGFWVDNNGIAPLCWLDLSDCDTSLPVSEIIAQAHENSQYQYAPHECKK